MPILIVVYKDLVQLLAEIPHKEDDLFVFYVYRPEYPMDQRELAGVLVSRVRAIRIPELPYWKKEGHLPLPRSHQTRGLGFHARYYLIEGEACEGIRLSNGPSRVFCDMTHDSARDRISEI